MTYLWVGYVLTWAAVGWYAGRLERRVGAAEGRLARRGADGPSPSKDSSSSDGSTA